MNLNFYIVDQDGQLRRTPREAVEDCWHGRAEVDVLGYPVGDELRLVTVLCNDDLEPIVTYFVRLDVESGRITDESKLQAFEAMRTRHRRRYDNDTAQRQFRGWPPDWQRQLAVALDVLPARLKRIGLGGPLLMSEIWGVPLEKVISYFEEAAGE